MFDEIIKKYVGESIYNAGKRVYEGSIEYYGEVLDKKARAKLHTFTVRSYYYYGCEEIDIKIKDNEIIESNCTCDYFSHVNMCQHIAACLINYQDELFYVAPEDRNKFFTKHILQELYKPKKKGSMSLKKQVFIDVELIFDNDSYNPAVEIKFKIGLNKMYSLSNKLNSFLSKYGSDDVTFTFGKNFEYNSEEHYFSKEDEEILKYLKYMHERNPYYNFQNYCLSLDDLQDFLNILENKEFTVVGVSKIKKISWENPFKAKLSKENGYKLSILKDEVDFLSIDYQYAIKNGIFYIIPEKFRKILTMMYDNNIEELVFEEEDVEAFSNGVLPLVRENIEVDPSVQDKFVLGSPNVKVYLDLKSGLVLCKLVFAYGENEVDYFDSQSNVLRDLPLEEDVVLDLLSYGFISDAKKIYMEDLDVIGNFLENGLITLAEKYEVFTSEKLKNTNVLKDSKVRSSFSIGTDNIMSFSFDLGDIKNDEIVNVLETMKSKKKYYRLKNGDILNLYDNANLQELESLVDDMEISKKEIMDGHGEIPKYRAIYLDSLKKDKYHIISTNNLFDELMNNFNSYKDVNVRLSRKDEKILRDYQVVGVKWLYNIYKCGFGGILADEMGLGKSIQFIYFIKEVLKERKDAKILIVAPTSLVYNWENEFKKFGSELSYRVLAEGREKRKEALENIGDVNILITTYGLVRQDKEQYMNIDFEVVALDEAQNIKNVNAQMTKIVKLLKARTKFALTGTPLENSVLELWSIFDFIMPGYLASQLSFQKKYNIKDVEEKDLNLLENLNRQIKPFILRRKKKEVVKELPDKLENIIYIELNKEQKKLYLAQLEKTQKEMDEIIASEGFKKGSFKILQLLTKLRQLCVDPRILYENYDGGSAKLENLIEFVKGIIENGHKVLLFTSFKTALDIVNKEFANHNISTYVIDGSVKSKKRMELVEKFNQDDTNVFLITLKSGGTGLNLTSADVVIHLDLWWNPQVEAQATDRAHRIGQKNIVEVVKLVCKGTIEERILELQNKKKILSNTLIEGEDRDTNILSKLTEKDIKRLLQMDIEEEE